ncbi:MAG: hypothetical protein AB7P31_01420 [Steroidobacteraceae bacterium]
MELAPARRGASPPGPRPRQAARWRLAAAGGEIQRAAALTAATWLRARKAVAGLLYDR